VDFVLKRVNMERVTRAPEQGAERRLMADVIAFGFAASGAIGLVSLLLPVPDTGDGRGILAVSIAAVAIAGLTFALRQRIPYVGYQLLLLIATGMVTASIYFNGHPANDNVMLYLFVGTYCFYFFRLTEAISHVLAMLVAYGWVTAEITPGRIEPTGLLVTAGVLLMTGLMVRLLGLRARQLVRELSRLATRDPLTGLLNRRGFQRLIDLELERSSRSGRPVSLVVGDLDGFKQVNDRLGHMGGDMALERVGSIMNRAKRKIDGVARLGGEEFALVLPDTDEHAAFVVAERIRTGVENDFKKRPVQLTMSLGVASYPEQGASLEELLHAADHGLYAAKALGRNRSVIYSAEADRVIEQGEAYAELADT
jgi:diguanylate cyclase (GGDEF)-like protein